MTTRMIVTGVAGANCRDVVLAGLMIPAEARRRFSLQRFPIVVERVLTANCAEDPGKAPASC
jgi:hypothetical protein